MEKQEIEKYVYKELGQMSFVEIADWVVDLCKRNDELSTELKKSKAIIETQRRRIKKLKEKQ